MRSYGNRVRILLSWFELRCACVYQVVMKSCGLRRRPWANSDSRQCGKSPRSAFFKSTDCNKDILDRTMHPFLKCRAGVGRMMYYCGNTVSSFTFLKPNVAHMIRLWTIKRLKSESVGVSLGPTSLRHL